MSPDMGAFRRTRRLWRAGRIGTRSEFGRCSNGRLRTGQLLIYTDGGLFAQIWTLPYGTVVIDCPRPVPCVERIRPMLMTWTGRSALTALLMLPTFALVGCADGAAEAPEPTVASAPASSMTPTATPHAGAAEPVWPNDRCQDEQLAAELVERPDLSTATREGLAIVLTNVSEQSCTYSGSPGALLLGADGTHLASRDDKILGPIEPEAGALAPGESAEAEALLTYVATYDCTPATVTTIQVLVTSDGAGPGIDAPADLQVCGDAWTDFTVGSLVPVS